MSAAHTAGPWVMDKNGTVWAHGDGVNDGICLVADVWDGNQQFHSRRSEEAFANRRLIAASPDLLAALDGLTNVFPYFPSGSEERIALANAQAAIAKARAQ